MTRFFVFVFLLLLGFGSSARAEDDSIDYTLFARLPVLEEGRVKPLERFAEIQLYRLAGEASFEGKPAILWLADTIFNPAGAASQKLFRVDSSAVRAAFGLPEAGRYRRFSLAELAPGLGKTADQVEALLQKKQDELSVNEKAMVDLHSQVIVFNQLMQSLSLLLPLPVTVPASIGAQEQIRSFVDAMRIEQGLIEQVRGFLTPANTANPDLLTPDQQELANFIFTLSKLRQGGGSNVLLRVIPSVWSDKAGEWFSPWQTILLGQSAPQTADLLHAWQDMAISYRNGDAELWAESSAKASALTTALMNDPALGQRLKLEVFYDKLHPYILAGFFYALTALLALVALWKGKSLQPAILTSLSVAAALHAGAMGLRIAILNRPPVGTLYESLLFVGLIMALTSLVVAWRTRKPTMALAGALGSGALLALAPVFQTNGESLMMLSAVLNTNFWLTVHVLCITAGYGFCLITALLAHGLLAFAPQKNQNEAGKILLYRLSLVALLFTTIGTLLGGVWADQSWGRFWGWDPKENGALLITLWLIWLQHGRITGQLSHQAWMAGTAYLTVVVALAWFGVNLLGIGLHSYGFVTGIAAGLIGFCIAETLLIATLWLRARPRHAA